MRVRLISPEGLHFDQDVAGFVYNSRTGQKTILEDQIETLSFFECTELSILAKENSAIFYIALGYVLVTEGESKIVAKIVSTKEEIYKRYQQLVANDINGGFL